MSLRLQIIIIIGMLMVLLYIFRKVAQKRLDYRYGIAWSFIVFIIILFAAWPKLLQKTANILGIYDPVNMLAFFGLGLAVYALFLLMMEVSKQADQIKKLTQELAILRKDAHDDIEKIASEQVKVSKDK